MVVNGTVVPQRADVTFKAFLTNTKAETFVFESVLGYAPASERVAVDGVRILTGMADLVRAVNAIEKRKRSLDKRACLTRQLQNNREELACVRAMTSHVDGSHVRKKDVFRLSPKTRHRLEERRTLKRERADLKQQLWTIRRDLDVMQTFAEFEPYLNAELAKLGSWLHTPPATVQHEQPAVVIPPVQIACTKPRRRRSWCSVM